MGTYKKYIDDLEIQKNNLVTALNNKGVEATNTETLNTLVPKVANIEGAKEEQEKTASASPNGAVIVTPDTGKVLSKVTINTIPTTTQATPTIAVSSGGLITVTSKQTEGYVKAGTKMPIKQLDVQGAKTITPSTNSQTAVSAYKFTTGAITVAGDVNLTAANIKAGTKIFGITGTHAGQKTEQTKTIDLSMASGNQTVTPDSGKVLNKVIVNKPSTLIPDNIKKDINIGGVVGTLENSGGGFPNGTKWTQSNITSEVINVVANANGLWIAGGNNSGLRYSIDGKAWSQSNIASKYGNSFSTLYHANGLWVTGGKKGLYYSVDGKTWTQSNIGNSDFKLVTNANGLWVAGGYSDKGLYYSVNGKTWTQSNITNIGIGSIYNANNLWVAGSADNYGSKGLYYSTDGKTWTQSNIKSYGFSSILNANGLWVAGGDNTKGFYYSVDGKTWTQSNITNIGVKSIYNANGLWAAGSNKGLYYSTDGKTWTQSNITDLYGYSVYNANGLWVAGGDKGLYYSVDGKTWTQSNIISGYSYSVYNGNGIWVVGSNEGLYYSVSWEPS